MKRQSTDGQNLGKLSSEPASVMRSGSTFVSLFFFFFSFFASRNKAKSFPEEERQVFWNLLSLSVIYSETRKLYPQENRTAKLILNFESVRDCCLENPRDRGAW